MKVKVNTFTKSKEMDTYTKSNEAERELYTQLADKAKTSTKEKKRRFKRAVCKNDNGKKSSTRFC